MPRSSSRSHGRKASRRSEAFGDRNSTDEPDTALDASAADFTDGGPREPQPRRLQFMEPDLTVVVGIGDNVQEFQHLSVLLCSTCSYFDTVLSAGMRERDEMRICFPDLDPGDWKVLFPYLESNSLKQMKIDPETAKRFIRWFDFVGMRSMVKKCDKVLCKQLEQDRNSSTHPNHELDFTLAGKWWSLCQGLPCEKTKHGLREWFLCYERDRQPNVTPNDITEIANALKEDEIVRHHFFSQVYVLADVKNLTTDDLFHSPLFPDMLAAKLRLPNAPFDGGVKLMQDEETAFATGPAVDDTQIDDDLETAEAPTYEEL